MPVPVDLLMQGVQLLAPAAQSQANKNAQRQQNEADRQFQLYMYEKQKQDALQFWHIQNVYNSPAEQMKRFKAGGLNPHLIYGQTNTAAPIKAPEPKQFNQIAPMLQGDLMAGYMAIQNVKQIQAQTNNLQKLNEVYEADHLLKIIKAENDTLDLNIKGELKDTVVELTKKQLEKAQADIDYTIDSNTRAELLNNAELAQKAAQTALTSTQAEQLSKTMEATIKKAISEAEYAEIEAQLAKEGFMRGDGYDVRALGEVSTALGAGKTIAEILKIIRMMTK